ncbi:hypothetical protein D3C83_217470 [compost metagenome]
MVTSPVVLIVWFAPLIAATLLFPPSAEFASDSVPASMFCARAGLNATMSAFEPS